MIRFAAVRLVEIAALLAVMSFVIYGLIGLMPGDPIDLMRSADPRMTAEDVARLKAVYGVDRPFFARYLAWAGQALGGELGYSRLFAAPVAAALLPRLGNSLLLMGLSFVLALALALALGTIAAKRAGSRLDAAINLFCFAGVSVPTFWLALVVILIFAVYLGWFPSIGYTRPQEDFVQFLKHVTLPMSVVALNIAATVLRFQRQDFLEQMHLDYVRTARAKGLSERLVLWKHVLRNSLMTTFTVVGLQMAYVSGLITIVETVFNYPGIGYLLLNSIRTRDFIVVQGVVLFMVFLVIIVNLLVDIFYTVIDPRIRY